MKAVFALRLFVLPLFLLLLGCQEGQSKGELISKEEAITIGKREALRAVGQSGGEWSPDYRGTMAELDGDTWLVHVPAVYPDGAGHVGGGVNIEVDRRTGAVKKVAVDQ